MESRGGFMTEKKIPLWEKYTLTLSEASEYLNIGINKIRELIKEERCNFVIYVGKKAIIKRVAFEKYLDSVTYL